VPVPQRGDQQLAGGSAAYAPPPEPHASQLAAPSIEVPPNQVVAPLAMSEFPQSMTVTRPPGAPSSPRSAEVLPGARADGCVAKWLEKKSAAKLKKAKGGGWQKRYFVFDPNLGEIRYMESPGEQNPHKVLMSDCTEFTSNNMAAGHFELHWLSRDKPMQLRVPDKQRSSLGEIEKLFRVLHRRGLLVRAQPTLHSPIRPGPID
jgi:hypothetical protein